MQRAYAPEDWYWLAGDGRLFASAPATLVAHEDPAYLAWREAGGEPTPWPRDGAGAEIDAALQEVLSPYGLHVSPAGAALATIDARAARVRAAVVGTEPAKIGVYKLKQEIGERAAAGDATALALIAAGGEHHARGITAEQMAAVWADRAHAWTAAVLKLDAVTASAREAIAAAPAETVAVIRDAAMGEFDAIAAALGV